MPGLSVFRLGERRRRWWVDRGRRGDCFGYDVLAVAEEDPPVVLDDRERTLERGRQPQGHLGRPVHERRQPSGRVATVRRPRWTAVTLRDREQVDVFA